MKKNTNGEKRNKTLSPSYSVRAHFSQLVYLNSSKNYLLTNNLFNQLKNDLFDRVCSVLGLHCDII